jgi:tol-pal system protein YbgF
MYREKRGIIILLLLWTVLCTFFTLGGDKKEEKVYELIYKDVQLIKKTLFRLESKVKQNQEQLILLQKNIANLEKILTRLQLEHASFKENQQEILLLYQAILGKFDSLSLNFQKIKEEIVAIKKIVLPAEETSSAETPPSEEQTQQTAESPPTQTTQTAKPPLPPDLSPQEIFNMAREDYLKGHYDLAIEGFRIYKANFPESPLADNASYWIGESLFSQGKYEEAINQFNELILNYPFSDKIAAAYLKKGLSLLQLDKKEEALTVFKLLVSKFPLEEETKIAQQKIKELIEKK